MIFEKANIIFFHPGKTGGSSILHELKDLHLPKNFSLNPKEENFNIMYGWSQKYKIYLQHADLFFYNKIGIDFKKYNTIVSIRRPYERILSAFYYNNLSEKYIFEDFIKNYLKKIGIENFFAKGHSINHFCPQISYFTDKNYQVSNIVKLENFQNDCKKIGLIGKYHYSKTKCSNIFKDYMDAYDQKTKDIVYNLYKEEFLLFDYKK